MKMCAPKILYHIRETYEPAMNFQPNTEYMSSITTQISTWASPPLDARPQDDLSLWEVHILVGQPQHFPNYFQHHCV